MSALLILVDGYDFSFVDGEREPTLLERERLLAEQLAAPALERGDVGIVVGGDAVEVVDGGDHLGGDAVALRRHAQEHLEQFDRRCAVRRRPEAFEPRQRLRVAREAALDRSMICSPQRERSKPFGSERR